MADLNELGEKLSAIRQEIKDELINITSSKNVYEYRKVIMDSKTGKIGSLMKEMGKIPNEMKAEYGKKVNEIKVWAQEQFDELDKKLKEAEMRVKYESEKIDVTLPAKKAKKGNLHPNTQMRNQLVDIFGSMGFDIYEGRGVSTNELRAF